MRLLRKVIKHQIQMKLKKLMKMYLN